MDLLCENMNNEINLIANKRQISETKKRTLKIIRQISFGFCGTMVFAAVILLLLNNSSGLDKLHQTEKSAEDSLSFLKGKIIKLLTIKGRMNDINFFIKNRTSYENTIDTIVQILPSDTTIVSFMMQKKQLSLVVSTPSLSSVNTVSDFFTSNVTQKKLFNKVTINSLVADIKGQKYNLSIDAELL